MPGWPGAARSALAGVRRLLVARALSRGLPPWLADAFCTAEDIERQPHWVGLSVQVDELVVENANLTEAATASARTIALLR